MKEHEIVKPKRTKLQEEIDSWIAGHIDVMALDKFIKTRLSEYPRFKRFNTTDVLNAIETIYLEIEPEEQYDPYVWATITERALAMLEPNKDKLFKIEFKNFGDYVKELTVGPAWIISNLDKTIEKICFKMAVNSTIDTCIDFDEDESIPCIIMRIS